MQKALQSKILVLDGNGPEVPPGAALLTGIGLVLGKTTLLYYIGAQTTHAHGREENARNLMLLYGCSSMAQTLEQLEKCLLREMLLRE
ncbi:MAG TPA: hypothetical protein VKR06_36455 [Ktedonosporobacter sp.]|nr:hypothetical protein [Ktedonosporobacter sp.]